MSDWLEASHMGTLGCKGSWENECPAKRHDLDLSRFKESASADLINMGRLGTEKGGNSGPLQCRPVHRSPQEVRRREGRDAV